MGLCMDYFPGGCMVKHFLFLPFDLRIFLEMFFTPPTFFGVSEWFWGCPAIDGHCSKLLNDKMKWFTF